MPGAILEAQMSGSKSRTASINPKLALDHLQVDEGVREGIIVWETATLFIHEKLLCHLQLPQPAAAP